MTSVAWGLLAVTAAFAVADWWATWNQRMDVRRVTKPATLVALIGVAITLDPVDPTIRTWMVIGLVSSLAGDVFLLMEEKFFVGGLASFLIGHIAYVVALQMSDRSIPWTFVGLAVVVLSVAVVGRKIVSAVAAGDSQMVGPVIAYLVVISAMVVSAFGTTGAWAIVGASLFYASDATLAWGRFVEPRRFGPIAVMITYHLGQAGLVAWLAWP